MHEPKTRCVADYKNVLSPVGIPLKKGTSDAEVSKSLEERRTEARRVVGQHPRQSCHVTLTDVATPSHVNRSVQNRICHEPHQTGDCETIPSQRCVRGQGRSPYTPGGSENASRPQGIHLKRMPQAPGN